MIYVQHLLGIGHLRRVWFLANALADKDIKVDLVSGGMPISGLQRDSIRLHQLPPVRSIDGSFDILVDEQGQPVNEAWKQNRRNRLIDLYNKIKPRLLITETFPFGRRMMRFELLPLLEAAKQSLNPPLVISSIRDILQPKSKAGRNQEVLHWIDAYYDKVLIHGDPEIAELGLTFPFADRISNKLFYTGYIINPAGEFDDTKDGYDEVIVSGGGGAASLNLLKTSVAAKPYSALNKNHWRLLVGNNIGQQEFDELRRSAGDGMTIERNRNDFPVLLKRCRVSISQAGYNTVMDILCQQAAAVLVPFAEAGELEQTLRARQLERHDRAICIEEQNLTPERLASAVDRAAKLEVRGFDIDIDGAGKSARLIQGWLIE